MQRIERLRFAIITNLNGHKLPHEHDFPATSAVCRFQREEDSLSLMLFYFIFYAKQSAYTKIGRKKDEKVN